MKDVLLVKNSKGWTRTGEFEFQNLKRVHQVAGFIFYPKNNLFIFFYV